MKAMQYIIIERINSRDIFSWNISVTFLFYSHLDSQWWWWGSSENICGVWTSRFSHQRYTAFICLQLCLVMYVVTLQSILQSCYIYSHSYSHVKLYIHVFTVMSSQVSQVKLCIQSHYSHIYSLQLLKISYVKHSIVL